MSLSDVSLPELAPNIFAYARDVMHLQDFFTTDMLGLVGLRVGCRTLAGRPNLIHSD